MNALWSTSKNRMIAPAVLGLAAFLIIGPAAAAAPTDSGQAAPTPSPGTAAVSSVASAPVPQPSVAPDPTPSVSDGSNYGGNPQNEAALVAVEAKRLAQLRTVSSIARWSGTKLTVPYRVPSATGTTLVLPARTNAYTVDDLLSLAPQTFVKQADGSFLLSENIVIEAGATLSLSNPTPTIYLLSTSKKFVSIVNSGGTLNVVGTADVPIRIGSWDPDSGGPRLVTDNGRSYVRSIGGTVHISHALFQDLGFWSGPTGGLSMVGQPVTSAAGRVRPPKIHVRPPRPPHVSSHGTVTVRPSPPTAPAPPPLQPGATLAVPDSAATGTASSAVSVTVSDTSITDNVYGLFLANTSGISVHNVQVKNSRMDGIVLHRNVSNAAIMDTTVRSSALNGFVVSRAASDIRLDTDKADSNGRDGIYVDGRSLASGPSATGTALASYGNDVVYGSDVANNGRYGVEVRGGKDITVRANTVTGGLVGIVVDASASAVTVTDNHLSEQKVQGIALRDGVTAGTVDNNSVSGAAVGIYLRNAQGKVENNTLSGMTNHGISAIGPDRIQIDTNTITGSGPEPVDLKRASNATAVNTSAVSWSTTRTLWQRLVAFFQPLTIIWTLLALILLFTAFSGHRHRGTVRHPYAAQAPMSTFTDLDPLILPPELINSTVDMPLAEGASSSGRRRRWAGNTRRQLARRKLSEPARGEARVS